MKLNNLHEMVQDYEARTGDAISFDGFYFDCHNGLKDELNTYFKFFPGTGFLFWDIFEFNSERYFRMKQTYGMVSGMVDYIKKVMWLNGLTNILTYTARDPKFHIRKWRMTHLADYDFEEDGRTYHVLIGTVDNLR